MTASSKKTWLIITAVLVFVLLVFALRFVFAVRKAGEQKKDAVIEQPKKQTLSDQMVVFTGTEVMDRGQSSSPDDDSLRIGFYRFDLASARFAPVKVFEVRRGFDEQLINPEQFGNSVLIRNYRKGADAKLFADGTFEEIPARPFASINNSSTKYATTLEPGDNIFDYRTSQVFIRIFGVDGIEIDRSDITSHVKNVSAVRPLGWSKDDKFVFIKPISLGAEERPMAGLWKFNTETREMLPYDEIFSRGIVVDYIDPSHNVAIGTTFRDSESIEDGPSGPSEVILIDLDTGDPRTILRDEKRVYTHPRLSTDGRQVAYGFADGSGVWTTFIDQARAANTKILSGFLIEWIGDWMIIDRNGELVAFHVPTGGIARIDQDRGTYEDRDYRDIEYIGAIISKEQN
ncbi:MAG: hypothetical protein ACD_76C00094G0033 [uncultured bacterium]|nr:MAG: hypothetical protein ACD_76C00094G0033 [uncultured bacterium]HBD05288.1 hypothetical protein [Candidatus Uhrbacteria bacterium]